MTTKTADALLLVDDDRLVLATLADGLKRAGYRVLEAADGNAGLRLAEAHRPDLALLDIRMPGMSGLELAQALRERTATPFMFLTAYGDKEALRIANDAGALGYLVKPLDVAQILPSLETALARARDLRALRETGEQLNQALAAGRETSMAVGLTMERFRVDRDRAFEMLRNSARSQRRKLSELSTELLDATELLNRVDGKPV